MNLLMILATGGSGMQVVLVISASLTNPIPRCFSDMVHQHRKQFAIRTSIGVDQRFTQVTTSNNVTVANKKY